MKFLSLLVLIGLILGKILKLNEMGHKECELSLAWKNKKYKHEIHRRFFKYS